MNYVTGQFYSCALHPTAFTNYCLAGTQDNGSHQFTSGTLQNTTEVTGGDGGFCHIDQDQPQFQWTSYVYNDYYTSTDGGSSWTNYTSGGGLFINPTDYDDANNKMYCARNANQYLRWDDPQTGGTFTTVAAASFGGTVTAVKVSPNTSNRVFFGANGDVFRVDNAHTGAPTITNISTASLPAAYLTCVEVETGNDNHILLTYSNYGVNSVWETTNGGTLWTSVEGNLPDMPIRWALFNPNNNDQAVIATELGVWSTDNLNGGSTNWGASNTGLANVRVDMLQVRTSDKLMIAATHGRGVFSSDVFTTPTALFSADQVTVYTGIPINFTSSSYRGTSWSWNFGDAGTSTAENPSHAYGSPGVYNVTLTINAGASTLTKTAYIHVLPNRGTPYTVAADGGTFEINVNDFGSMSIRGNTDKWERGVPSNFLTTVNSAVNAWKTDLDADLTQGDYACVLMTPNYNFTAAGTYILRFRRSMEIAFCNAPFAVQVQYSTNKGVSWTRLGVNADPAATNWYNRGPATGCPVDAAVFPDRYGWTITSNNTLCTYNLTTGVPALVGQPNVAFRFVLSVAPGYSASGYAVDGFMVDDFEILGPINVALSLDLLNFSAMRKDNDALLNWQTANEKGITQFLVERSYDAVNFVPVGSLPAKNQVSNTYSFKDAGAALNAGNAKNIFYRLKISDQAGKIKYSEVARISLDKNAPLVTVGPNPFTGSIFIYSNELIKKVTLFDPAGRVVYQTDALNGNRISINSSLPAGTYVIKIQTGSGMINRKIVKVAR